MEDLTGSALFKHAMLGTPPSGCPLATETSPLSVATTSSVRREQPAWRRDPSCRTEDSNFQRGHPLMSQYAFFSGHSSSRAHGLDMLQNPQQPPLLSHHLYEGAAAASIAGAGGDANGCRYGTGLLETRSSPTQSTALMTSWENAASSSSLCLS